MDPNQLNPEPYDPLQDPRLQSMAEGDVHLDYLLGGLKKAREVYEGQPTELHRYVLDAAEVTLYDWVDRQGYITSEFAPRED